MQATGSPDEGVLDEFVACPNCKGGLEFSADSAACVPCGLRFGRLKGGGYDFLPVGLRAELGPGWGERQRQMEEWYHRLADSPQSAAGCFTSDYVPFGGLLGSLSGTVLDLGGGNGVARHYLPARVRYVVVDPSLEWLGSEWAPVGEWFPCLASRPYFVQGVGERLPFRAHAFDAVLSFWSLNHVERPGEVFREVARVLRPGGRFLAVLEDMEPRWRDLLPAPVGARGPGRKAALFAKKAARSLRGKPWDLQSDHLRISESDLQDWGEPDLAVTARTWVGQYLTYEFRKR